MHEVQTRRGQRPPRRRWRASQCTSRASRRRPRGALGSGWIESAPRPRLRVRCCLPSSHPITDARGAPPRGRHETCNGQTSLPFFGATLWERRVGQLSALSHQPWHPRRRPRAESRPRPTRGRTKSRTTPPRPLRSRTPTLRRRRIKVRLAAVATPRKARPAAVSLGRR